ncbi:MAG: rod shape-determining protein MreC, partial [Thermodesulfobacteriota bacterium]
GTAQSGVTGVVGYFGGLWDNYIDLLAVRDENLRLKEEIGKYQAINTKYVEAFATNVRLSKLLDLKETIAPPTLTARIIGRDPSQWFKTFSIDRSSSDGVAKGMPVVTIEGVIGHVLDGGSHHAKVLQANDPNSAIEVLIQNSRAQGIVKGTGTGYRLHYVLKNNAVKPGDQLVTSGLGGVFPKGIPVGTVSSVVSNRRGMFLDIEVTPAVDFSKLENVLILMKSNQLAE